MNLLYIHVPKTAGSSINKFFEKNTESHYFHIENLGEKLNNHFCEKYQYISGHVPYSSMEQILDLQNWITFVTIREPISYVVSHIKWIRKLAEPQEIERFNAHPKPFQIIATKMKEYDFSKPLDISKFILWLEENEYYFLHNTQAYFMNATLNQSSLSDLQVERALKNLEKINFVGTQDELDEYLKLISYEFGWQLENIPQENTNSNNYGLDKSNKDICQALLPLYEKDNLIYLHAQKLFKNLKAKYNHNSINIKGFVDLISSNKILGWATYNDSLKKVDLELKLNGKVIQSEKANIYREGLFRNQIHITGMCAFEFNFEKIENYRELKVYIKGTNIHLPISNPNAIN